MENSHIINIAFYIVAFWIIAVIVFLVFLLRKYTFGRHWTKENPNPYAMETFGMPRGVLRGILTLSLLFMVMLLELLNLGLISKGGGSSNNLLLTEDRYKDLMIAFQMMIAFYFGSKVMHHVTKADERKSKKIADSIAESTMKPSTTSEKDEFEEEGAVG